jgi:hypothetical protein
MIDFFALALSHGLLALACWRILLRGDLDEEKLVVAPDMIGPPAKTRPGLRTRA